MKNLILIILIPLISGCVNEQWIRKKVNKATPERVLAYLQQYESHLFKQRIDTIRDTVQIKTVAVDTVFHWKQLHDTITITKDRLTTKVWIKHDSIFVNSECVGDTIYIEKIVGNQIPAREYKVKQWWVIPAIISSIGLLFVLILVSLRQKK
jgi:hypothetical protein